MPYVIKKNDGNIVATVTDGTVDTSSTSLTLIGKNYKGIGEIYNTNLVYLLESFANSSPPNNQIKGQLWFNTSSSKLNVYDGSSWRPVGSPFVSNSRPSNLVQGDLWIDSGSQQLKFYDGANLITAGPEYTASQGKTGWVVEEIIDTRGNTKIVGSMYVANIRMAILNTVEFVPLLPIDGFTTGILPLKAGLSFSFSVPSNNINAPAQSAQTLVDPVDGELTTDKFVRSDKSGSITGSLTLTGAAGLTLGPNSNISLYVDTSGGVGNYHTMMTNQVENSKLTLQVRDPSGFQNAIVLDPALKKVSLYPTDTWATTQGIAPQFYVNANTTITGSLTVVGETQFTNSTTVQISDKNIELAVVDNPTNTTANGAGITVLGGSNNNKTLKWSSAGITVTLSPLVTLPTWEVNDNFKVPSTNGYYVGSNPVLNTTTLGPTVVTSSLTTVGTLGELAAAQFTLVDNVITVDPSANLEINVDAGKIITLTNRVRINNVEAPALQFDVANKDYVDQVKTSINYITIDTTNFSNPEVDAISQINGLIPATTVNVNDIVRVLCLNYDSIPIVTKMVRVYACELVFGTRTWVHQTGQDLVV
jgi:hypothetical protein